MHAVCPCLAGRSHRRVTRAHANTGFGVLVQPAVRDRANGPFGTDTGRLQTVMADRLLASRGSALATGTGRIFHHAFSIFAGGRRRARAGRSVAH